VAFDYQLVFLALLGVYLVAAVVRGWNPVWPVYGALVLLLAAGGSEALGDATAANNLALDVVFTLGVAVALAGIDRLRAPRDRSPPGAPASEASQPVEPAPEHSLDDLEGKAIPVVDAPRAEHDEHVEGGDAEPDRR
jgi:hypothetical protein